MDRLGSAHAAARANNCITGELTPAQSRFVAYQTVRKYLDIFTGKGNRVKLPLCIEALVKDEFSEASQDMYRGFRQENLLNVDAEHIRL